MGSKDHLHVVLGPNGKPCHDGFLDRAAAVHLAVNESHGASGTWTVRAPFSQTTVAKYRNGRKI